MRSILRERPLPGDAPLGAFKHSLGEQDHTSIPTASTIFRAANDTLDIAYNMLASKNGLLCPLVPVACAHDLDDTERRIPPQSPRQSWATSRCQCPSRKR